MRDIKAGWKRVNLARKEGGYKYTVDYTESTDYSVAWEMDMRPSASVAGVGGAAASAVSGVQESQVGEVEKESGLMTKVQALIERLGRSQLEVATESGCAPVALNHWLRGSNTQCPSTIAAGLASMK